MYVTNICRNYSTKQRVNAKLNLYFLHVIVQYVCCILLLCWYTCNQSYIEQFFNLHISTLHPSAISSISFKNQVNMKYMQSVFPLFTVVKELRSEMLSSSGTSQLGMFDIQATTKSKYYDQYSIIIS